MFLSSSIKCSVFEPTLKLYESYQVNGTKYLKNIKNLDDKDLKQQLEACAGEVC